MNVVIIEDEVLVAKDLKKILQKEFPELKVMAMLESVKASMEYFSANPYPDLIFADIQLSDGVSFDIFKDKEVGTPIIFTTAYDQYAIEAFRLNSIDYLLKPIDGEELRRAVRKFQHLSGAKNDIFNEQLKSMLLDLKPETRKKFKTRFTGHIGKSIVAIPEEQVAYFTKDEIIFLITHDNKQVVTDYASLEELEDLVNPEKFIRANRQFIVNISAIESLKSHFTGKLQIELKAPLKAEISVSREKASEFRKWFEGN